jgi:hypothetical protein
MFPCRREALDRARSAESLGPSAAIVLARSSCRILLDVVTRYPPAPLPHSPLIGERMARMARHIRRLGPALNAFHGHLGSALARDYTRSDECVENRKEVSNNAL